MAKRQRDEEPERHGIRLPGTLLDELKGITGESCCSRTQSRASTNVADDDQTRFQGGIDTKKRKTASRKDKRRQERADKKKKAAVAKQQAERSFNKMKNQSKSAKSKKPDKRSAVTTNTPKKQEEEEEGEDDEDDAFSDFDGFSDGQDAVSQSGESDDYSDFEDGEDLDDEFGDDQPQTAEDTIAALTALKKKKQQQKNQVEKPEPTLEEDIDLEEEFGEGQPQTAEDTMAALMALKKTKKKQPKEKFDLEEGQDEIDLDEEFGDDQPQTADDTMAALMALKKNKKQAASKSKKDEQRQNELKNRKESTQKTKKKEREVYMTPEEARLRKRDEDDMKYYAKKLGLKSTKNNDFRSKQDDDGLGDLLDGLDFLDNDSGGKYYLSDEEISEEEDQEEEDQEELEEQDEGTDGEGQDSDEEEIVENPFSSDDELNSSDFDSDIDPEESEEDGDVIMAKPKENPYAPAVASTTKYVPPAMRARLGQDSELLSKVKRAIKGPLNRLSEANVITIVNDIQAVYLDNPRQIVTECLTALLLESIVQQSTLMDTFVTLHAAVISATYRSQGVEVGAYFIQTLVEQYEVHYKADRTKEAGNLISLLTACYSFQVVSCKLLYNLIEQLIQNFSEQNSELLLRIVRNAGQQLRSDDPHALREIILQFQKNIQGQETNARTKFLVETITNLKNNKSKVNETTAQLTTRMRKMLATIGSKQNEPLQVTLDDIHSVETKGKWWLVGSAWKGNEAKTPEVDRDEMNEILDSAEPNWMELARSQRMNTDIRRAIFISIMSSADYIEAFTKLDKLRLNRSQEREMPKILLHCVSIEKVYNPYYGLLASKLCSTHGMRKTLQFCFWDLIHELEGEDGDDDDYFKRLSNDLAEDEDFQMQRLVSLGKFFGVLIADGSLPLHSLKAINFLAMTSDMSLFIEVLMISFFDTLGKKSEVAPFGSGAVKSKAQDLKFSDQLLLERLGKCQGQKMLLRGLQYFLQKVRGSDIITGKKQRRRVEWGVDSTVDMCTEMLKG